MSVNVFCGEQKRKETKKHGSASQVSRIRAFHLHPPHIAHRGHEKSNQTACIVWNARADPKLLNLQFRSLPNFSSRVRALAQLTCTHPVYHVRIAYKNRLHSIRRLCAEKNGKKEWFLRKVSQLAECCFQGVQPVWPSQSRRAMNEYLNRCTWAACNWLSIVSQMEHAKLGMVVQEVAKL